MENDLYDFTEMINSLKNFENNFSDDVLLGLSEICTNTIDISEMQTLGIECLANMAKEASQMAELSKQAIENFQLYFTEYIPEITQSLEIINDSPDEISEYEHSKFKSFIKKFNSNEIIKFITTIYAVINILCMLLGTTPLEVRNRFIEFIKQLIHLNNMTCIECNLSEYSIDDSDISELFKSSSELL